MAFLLLTLVGCLGKKSADSCKGNHPPEVANNVPINIQAGTSTVISPRDVFRDQDSGGRKAALSMSVASLPPGLGMRALPDGRIELTAAPDAPITNAFSGFGGAVSSLLQLSAKDGCVTNPISAGIPVNITAGPQPPASAQLRGPRFEGEAVVVAPPGGEAVTPVGATTDDSAVVYESGDGGHNGDRRI